jgi:integrase
MANVTKYETASGVRYRVRYRKPDGTQTDKRGFKRKIDATNWAAEHVTVAKAKGLFVDPSLGRATVGSLAPAWLAKKKLSVKPSYYDDLEAACRNYVIHDWGTVPVDAVARDDVQRWVTRISNGTKAKDEAKSIPAKSASVVLRAHGILAGILDDAVSDRRIGANPARGVELPRKAVKRHAYLSAGQLDAVAQAAGWRRDMVLALGLCGMRLGELVPLRVGDVDLERRRIWIGVSAPMVHGMVTPGDTKTHESRSIMFPAALDAVMRSRCEGRAKEALLFEAPGRPGEYMKEFGAASSGDGWLVTALKRAGVKEHLTLHDLRHTAASLMVRAGANVKAVQRQLGHKSAAMTLDTYADLFDDDLDSLSDSMSQMLLRENVGRMWANEVSEAS